MNFQDVFNLTREQKISYGNFQRFRKSTFALCFFIWWNIVFDSLVIEKKKMISPHNSPYKVRGCLLKSALQIFKVLNLEKKYSNRFFGKISTRKKSIFLNNLFITNKKTIWISFTPLRCFFIYWYVLLEESSNIEAKGYDGRFVLHQVYD